MEEDTIVVAVIPETSLLFCLFEFGSTGHSLMVSDIGVFCVRDFYERIPVVTITPEFEAGNHAGQMYRYRLLDKEEHVEMVGHDLFAEDTYLRKMRGDPLYLCINGFAEVGEIDIGVLCIAR